VFLFGLFAFIAGSSLPLVEGESDTSRKEGAIFG
jgi:hypothetical protein